MLHIKMHKKFSCLIILLFAIPAFSETNNSNGILPLPPRVFIDGSSGTTTFGEGDAMIPIWGNSEQTFYGDIDAKVGDDQAWFASAGLGGRKIIRNTIFGVYFFADYNKTPNATYLTVLNPGIEFMTNHWDGHLNGYVPLGKKNNGLGVFPGSYIGMSNTNFFRGHTEYDVLFDQIENVSPGFDLEVGHTISSPNLKRTRIFAGGYYFHPEYSSNINGVEVGFEMPLNYPWASVVFRDTYDNIYDNTVLLTLRLTLGGLDKNRKLDIHDRMLDRIPRHIANLNNGDGIPSPTAIINTGQTTIIKDNIWFFNADGAPTVVQGFQSCTFENPCIGLAQTQIDTINGLAPNANFYFSSGTYNNPAVGTGFSFYNGQNIFGRANNFMQPAAGNERPLLNDSLLLNGNNNVYNVRIVGNSELNIDVGGMNQAFHTGILVTTTASGTINIFDTDVVTTGSTLNAGAVINNSNTATLNIYNSTLTSYLTDLLGGVAVGAGNVGSGNINIYGTVITVNQSDTTNTNPVFGVVNNDNGTINISNSEIRVNSASAGITAGVLNNSTMGSGTINITDSSISVIADNSFLAADVFNQANNGSGIGGTVNINNSSLSIISNNNGGGIGSGIFNSADSTVNLTNSVINSSGNDGIIVGIFNSDPLSEINLQNNSISINLIGTAIGMPIINGGTFNDEGGNQCFQDGAPVPC